MLVVKHNIKGMMACLLLSSSLGPFHMQVKELVDADN